MPRKIEEWPTYVVSRVGEIIHISGNLKKQQTDKYGYRKVMLYDKGRIKNAFVHRLVAKAYIDNPENKAQINHIDGNKTNNHKNNLEWCTNSENTQHAYNNGLMVGAWKGKKGFDHNRSIAVISINSDGVEKIHGSIEEAAKYIGGDQSFISKACRGKVKSAYSMKWKIANHHGKPPIEQENTP